MLVGITKVPYLTYTAFFFYKILILIHTHTHTHAIITVKDMLISPAQQAGKPSQTL